MNARRRIVTACAAAFVFSGAATLALSLRLAHVSAAESTRMRSYVAPARLIPAGEQLQAADLHLVPWPASSPVPDAFDHLDDAIGRTTLYPLAPGQPVLGHDLTPRGSGPGLAGRIPDGMRALAIKSDEVVGVGGFLSPGLHVDMLVTLQGSGTPVTSTVLQDAEVIAVGQQSEPDPQGKPTTATVVTLLLTPDQVQRALLSSSQGAVHFVLRNSADRISTHNAPATMADLGGVAPHAPMLQTEAMIPTPLKAATSPRPARPHVSNESAMPEMILSGRSSAPISAPTSISAEGKR